MIITHCCFMEGFTHIHSLFAFLFHVIFLLPLLFSVLVCFPLPLALVCPSGLLLFSQLRLDQYSKGLGVCAPLPGRLALHCSFALPHSLSFSLCSTISIQYRISLFQAVLPFCLALSLFCLSLHLSFLFLSSFLTLQPVSYLSPFSSLSLSLSLLSG